MSADGSASTNNPQSGSGSTISAQPEVLKGLATDLEDMVPSMKLAAEFREPGPGGFGGSQLGQQLVTHTHLARGHVVTGVHTVTTALNQYIEGLHYFRKGITDADQGAHSGLTTIDAATNSLGTSLARNKADNRHSTLPDATGYGNGEDAS